MRHLQIVVRAAAHHHPVVSAMMVQLQRQPPALLHHDVLDLVASPKSSDWYEPPRPVHFREVLRERCATLSSLTTTLPSPSPSSRRASTTASLSLRSEQVRLVVGGKIFASCRNDRKAIAMNMLMQAARTAVRNSRFLRLAAHVVRPYDAIYHRNYYAETVEAPARESATVMAASMIDVFKPQTIIDVGCGTGALLEAFQQLGCNVFGLEYSDAALDYCRQRTLPVKKFNIAKR